MPVWYAPVYTVYGIPIPAIHPNNWLGGRHSKEAIQSGTNLLHKVSAMQESQFSNFSDQYDTMIMDHGYDLMI